ncbi:MAG: hypothetical protein KDB07_11930, partial [Planctomycetes bacterium]|nr:hypothetical protein [Planctomycetota bacterium]
IGSPGQVVLDGRASIGVQNFQWTQLAGPVVAPIASATLEQAVATLSAAGDYLFMLTVTSAAGSASDTVLVSLLDGVPSVDAGPDVAIAAQEIVLVGMDAFASVGLNASANDPTNDQLFVTWSLVRAPATGNLVIVDRNSLATDIQVFGSVIEAGVYEFRIDVADQALLGLGQVVSDTVRLIVIGEGTRPPTANAGNDRIVTTSTLVILDGSRSSDPDAMGAPALGYAWQMLERPSTSAATLQGTTNQNTAFSADAAGRYRVGLIVTDGEGLASLQDVVEIIAFNPSNNLPRSGVSMTPSGTLTVGQSVTLSAALDADGIGFEGSLDFEGDTISALWEFLDGPTNITIVSPTQIEQTLSFSVVGVYRFRVVVNDGTSEGVPHIVQVNVSSGGVAMPNAAISIDPSDDNDSDGHVTFVPNFGVDRDIANRQIDLLSTGSSVGGGQTIEYRWSQVSGPLVGLIGTSAANAGFIPSEAGLYVFELRVSDGSARYATTQFTVAVDTHDALHNPTGNALPRVTVPADKMVEPGQEVMLTGSGFDPNGSNVTLTWVQFAGPPINIERPSAGVMRFTPSGDADYVFALFADDGAHAGLAREVRVTVRGAVIIDPPPTGGGGGGGG